MKTLMLCVRWKTHGVGRNGRPRRARITYWFSFFFVARFVFLMYITEMIYVRRDARCWIIRRQSTGISRRMWAWRVYDICVRSVWSLWRWKQRNVSQPAGIFTQRIRKRTSKYVSPRRASLTITKILVFHLCRNCQSSVIKAKNRGETKKHDRKLSRHHSEKNGYPETRTLSLLLNSHSTHRGFPV